MRVSREKMQENREQILRTASLLFRDKGFDGVGIDAVMQGAGLTHGGFYRHFASKDDLAAQALASALERGAERQAGFTDLRELVSSYLSDRHCADRAHGCAIAALGSEVARHNNSLRHLLAAQFRKRVDKIAGLLRFGSAKQRRERAIATLAGMVGALILARAVDDPALSREILGAARAAFGSEPGTGDAAPSRPQGR